MTTPKPLKKKKVKTIKAKCAVCGDVRIRGPFMEADEEGFIVPVAICPTFRSLQHFYTRHSGSNYEYDTGNKMADNFKQKIMELNHENPDEFVGKDENDDWTKHQLKPLLCWYEVH